MSETAIVQLFSPSPKPPRKPRNQDRRSREFLTEDEVERVMKAADKGWYGFRDKTMILMAYRHGFRVSELIALRWDQVDLRTGLLTVNRLKKGIRSVHPMGITELQALGRLNVREHGVHVFTSERGLPMSASNFRKMVARAGVKAGLAFPIHPHMLRHATGYFLANSGQDTRAIQHYLGHKNITHTVRYTELSPDRFKDFWQD